MKKLKQIDRATCRLLNKELETAMQAVADKFGLKVEIRGGRFTSNSFKPRIEFETVGADGESNRDKSDFMQYCEIYGLKPEHFGAKVKFGREEFEIVGLNLRAKTMPVQLRNVNSGSLAKCPVDAVITKL